MTLGLLAATIERLLNKQSVSVKTVGRWWRSSGLNLGEGQVGDKLHNFVSPAIQTPLECFKHLPARRILPRVLYQSICPAVYRNRAILPAINEGMSGCEG